MRSNYKNIIVFLLVVFFSIYWIAIMLVIFGKINISYQGFAIDSKNNLYIGYGSGIIKKYKDKTLLRTISAQTSRGYDFTILENDVIYVDCGNRAHYIDSNGTVLKTITKDIPRFTELRPSLKEFLSTNGTLYRLENSFGRTKIVEYSNTKKTIIYEMPLFDFLVKILVGYGTVLFMIIVTLFVWKNRRETIRGRRIEIRSNSE